MFSFNMFADSMRPFTTTYKCYSVSMLPGNERHDVEKGGKIIMPPSALDQLTRLNIVYPMLFKLTNVQTQRITHCGVLEFVADEGKVYLPYWMMRNLLLDEGSMLKVESTSLPVATFSRFQPQSVDFLDITNPKAVLENALRNFACLTTGDVIAIDYNDHIYELCVLETKPGSAVTIIECDMNVEFAAPVGYKEPQRFKPVVNEAEEIAKNIATNGVMCDGIHSEIKFHAFSGKGNRLDGKTKQTESQKPQIPMFTRRGVPDYDYQLGSLSFIRIGRSTENGTQKNEKEDKAFKPFSGEGKQLYKPKLTKA